MLKPKILPDDIEGLSFIDYRKMFIKELKRMKAACSEPGQTTNFMIMTENIFCRRSAFTFFRLWLKALARLDFFSSFFKFSEYTNYEQGDNNKF